MILFFVLSIIMIAMISLHIALIGGVVLVTILGYWTIYKAVKLGDVDTSPPHIKNETLRIKHVYRSKKWK